MNTPRLLLIATLAALAFPAAATATTFTVDSTSDTADPTLNGSCDTDGGTDNTPCTLRAAIQEANSASGRDAIAFDTAAMGGTPTITVGSFLPEITGDLDINGCSGSLNSPQPCVGLTKTGSVSRGLAYSSAVTAGSVRGLAIHGFTSIGITSDGGGMTFRNNWFGLSLAETVSGFGTHLQLLGDNNVVGGTTGATGAVPADRNVFAGGGMGVRVFSGDGNQILGNYFGTTKNGASAALHRQGTDAISVVGPTGDAPAGTVIGDTVDSPSGTSTTCDGACNVIAASQGNGIDLDAANPGEASAVNTTIRGNFVGLDVTGANAAGNFTGIKASNASGVVIGGPTDRDRNFIGGNTRGVQAGPGLTLQNNFIGLRSDGGAAIPDSTAGAFIVSASQGSPALITGNRFAGNGTGPIEGLAIAPGTGVTVTGNSFGRGVGGERLPIASRAINVNASDATISGNVIANTELAGANCCGVGIHLADGAGVTIKGNRIGADGGNEGAGISIDGTSDNVTVGGDTAPEENLIANNGGNAVEVAEANGIFVARNAGTANGGLFLDLGDDGPGNPLGVNGGALPPAITSAGTTSAAGTAPAGSTVRVFRASAATNIEAFLGSATASGGSWALTYAAVPAGQFITVSQTSGNNTSEFASALVSAPPGGGPAPGPGNTPPDPAPGLSRYSVGPSTFAAAPRGASIARKRPAVGTTVRYTLSEAARVTFTVERVGAGRRAGGRCGKPTRANRRKPRCDLPLAGSFTHAGRAGSNRFRFTGRLRGRKLAPGRYKLAAVARDSGGQRSAIRRVAFRLVVG